MNYLLLQAERLRTDLSIPTVQHAATFHNSSTLPPLRSVTLPPTEPHPFPVAAPAAPRGPFSSDCSASSSSAEVHSSPPPQKTSTSNKRRRTPVCCYSREACSHGRPAPGQLRALCIHKTHHKIPSVFEAALSFEVHCNTCDYPHLSIKESPHYCCFWGFLIK